MSDTSSEVYPCNSNPAASAAISRRQLMAMAAAATAAVGLSRVDGRDRTPQATPHAGTLPVVQMDLSGTNWTLQQQDTGHKISAAVPGCNYQTLMEHKLIPDFWYRENNHKVQWVAEKTWIYEREFVVSTAMLAKAHVELICHGLDTLASISINGRHVADTDNMFRTYALDVKPHLRAGANAIRVVFSPLNAYVKEHQQAYDAKYKINLAGASSWVRKAPYMWGWDWCRQLLPAGIWKKMELLAFDARLTDLGLLQQRQADGSVRVDAHATTAGDSAGHALHATAYLGNQTVAHGKATVAGGETTISMVIQHPRLWWPNGMGEQPLYHVKVELRNANGHLADAITRRTGLRTIEVLPPADGKAMHVKVNGVALFVKGADWVPPDGLPSRVPDETWRWYARTAAESNFNFIRLWGGGYYEADAMFDACDELGILLQFEFKFANTVYPVRDKAFVDNVSAEFHDNIRRTRNHPSIAIWSGNNEIGYFKGYNYLFGKIVGGAVRKLLPGAFYEKGSGAFGSGDIHDWTVWHGQQPFSAYRNIEGFVTEFGMQSFPEPKTVRAYTDAADRTSVHTPVMRYHQRDGSGRGNGIIMQYVHEYFGREISPFNDALWLSQIMQAYAIRTGVEHWRRNMPASMGSAIWQFNDCWPAPTWSMIDRYRRFKAAQYHSKHFFAPLLVSPVLKGDALDVYVVSDRMKDCGGMLSWRITDLTGNTILSGDHNVQIPARASRLAQSIDCEGLLKKHGARNVIAWTQLRVGSRAVSENIAVFALPRMLSLKPVKINTHVAAAADGYDVTLSADRVALYAFLDLRKIDATYSDNFVHLHPGMHATIHVKPAATITHQEFVHRLGARSLIDLAELGPPAPIAAAPDGTFHLTPDAAILHGPGLLVDNEHGARNIGWWNNPAAFVSWKFDVKEGGRYDIIGNFATPQGSVKLRLTLAGHTLEKPVPKTPTWRQPEKISFGAIEIPHAGVYQLVIGPGDAAHWHPVNVLGMTVTPVR